MSRVGGPVRLDKPAREAEYTLADEPHGAWRSLVSALDWGSRGRWFESSRPDLK